MTSDGPSRPHGGRPPPACRPSAPCSRCIRFSWFVFRFVQRQSSGLRPMTPRLRRRSLIRRARTGRGALGARARGVARRGGDDWRGGIQAPGPGGPPGCRGSCRKSTSMTPIDGMSHPGAPRTWQDSTRAFADAYRPPVLRQATRGGEWNQGRQPGAAGIPRAASESTQSPHSMALQAATVRNSVEEKRLLTWDDARTGWSSKTRVLLCKRGRRFESGRLHREVAGQRAFDRSYGLRCAAAESTSSPQITAAPASQRGP